MATTCKIVTCYVDKELDDKIYAMRKDERYMRCSKSEIVRMLIMRGLENALKESSSNRSPLPR